MATSERFCMRERDYVPVGEFWRAEDGTLVHLRGEHAHTDDGMRWPATSEFDLAERADDGGEER
ncbi:hypothetical protein GC089_15520 [Cellulomonas sp. JZ18]|uniref:hypothetical protein n=1 Tax=Cellulomonas sp. JZ18 TaxID=2654191 RepID=UPI0012D38635|nr:hypothetical protein [Cellulomonas sp. JZ18]QGQ20340.1 hypothetical protein GC089_15520 [Cellulomonas sp. JZ18]